MGLLVDLKAKADEIKAETQIGQNTASRVGGLLTDIIDLLSSFNTSITNINTTVFPQINKIGLTGTGLSLDATHRFCAVNSTTPDEVLSLGISGDHPVRIHTVVNVSSVTIAYKAMSGDNLNGISGGGYDIDPGECVSVMSFGNDGWWIMQ
jgi:hypothetical protein